MQKPKESCRSRADRSSTGTALPGRAGQILIANVELGCAGSPPVAHAGRCRSERYLRLEIVRRGRMTFKQHGETLCFGTGDMLLLDPSLPFSRSFLETTQISVLHISRRALNDRGVSCRFTSACHPVRETDDIAALRALLLAFTAYVDHASDALLERLGNQFLDLMDVVIENSGALQRGRSTKAVVLRANQLISRRLGDADLSVASIAEALSVSISSLARAFRQRGLSPMRYVYSLRLEHASRLLAGTPDLAIQDVADRCGFTSPAHFSRLFKQKHGMTPREYASLCGSREAGEISAASEA